MSRCASDGPLPHDISSDDEIFNYDSASEASEQEEAPPAQPVAYIRSPEGVRDTLCANCLTPLAECDCDYEDYVSHSPKPIRPPVVKKAGSASSKRSRDQVEDADGFVELQPPTKRQKEIQEETDDVMDLVERLDKAKKKARDLGLHHCPICGSAKVERAQYGNALQLSAGFRQRLQPGTGVIPLVLAPCQKCLDTFSRTCLIEFNDKNYFQPSKNVFMFTLPGFKFPTPAPPRPPREVSIEDKIAANKKRAAEIRALRNSEDR